jgi:hypothetical protein
MDHVGLGSAIFITNDRCVVEDGTVEVTAKLTRALIFQITKRRDRHQAHSIAWLPEYP